MSSKDRPEAYSLSVVVPFYNEADAIEPLMTRLLAALRPLTESYEIVCVDDGSIDGSYELLERFRRAEPRIRLVRLTRNFGKDVALTAGIDHASGDAVIPIDADLQDPPELIPSLVERWLEGFDMVVAVRTARPEDGFWRRQAVGTFYRVLGRLSDVPIPANAGDYRLLDRSVVDALKRLPERNRFMKGLFAWVGFSQSTVPFVREKRVTGKSRWKRWRLWNFALDGLLSFSTLPLRIWSYVGLGVSVFAGLYALYVVVRTLIYGIELPGYASLMVVVLFFSGINLIGLGILGEYVGRLSVEAKQRPLYLVETTAGFAQQGVGDRNQLTLSHHHGRRDDRVG